MGPRREWRSTRSPRRTNRRWSWATPSAPTAPSPTGPPGWPAPCTPSASRPTARARSPPWCPNGFEFFETAAASCRAEARFLPVNWHLKTDELAWILADSGAQVLVADHSLREYVDAALPHAPRLPRARSSATTTRTAIANARGRRQRRLPVARVHLLHIGHHGPAQGRRARRAHTGREWGRPSADSRRCGASARTTCTCSPDPRTTPVLAATRSRRCSPAEQLRSCRRGTPAPRSPRSIAAASRRRS